MNPSDSNTKTSGSGGAGRGDVDNDDPTDGQPATVAPFSSTSIAARASYHQVFQKSPLLATTPPQITRALSQSYPYLSTLNWLGGLVTWTSGDPWESFLMVAVFWAFALYGDLMMVWAGNVVVVVILIVEETHPSLDEIVETLNSLTNRLNILCGPFQQLTAFLSTTASATKATTRPALTHLFIRILFVSPIWLILTLPPLQLVTPRRIFIFVGTTILSWHSRPARISRTILWRSLTVRNMCERLTGLDLHTPTLVFTQIEAGNKPGTPAKIKGGHLRTPSSVVATHLANKSSPLSTRGTTKSSPGVRFTFSIYENQRRWLGVGWTSSLFAYERAAWTDEHLNPCPPVEEFTLPPAKNGMKWRWVDEEEWKIDGEDNAGSSTSSPPPKVDAKKAETKQDIKDRIGGKGEEGKGWIYYDNKWRDGKRGVDGWGKYTRRRRYTRVAELVEDDGEDNVAVPAQELEGSEVMGQDKRPSMVGVPSGSSEGKKRRTSETSRRRTSQGTSNSSIGEKT